MFAQQLKKIESANQTKFFFDKINILLKDISFSEKNAFIYHALLDFYPSCHFIEILEYENDKQKKASFVYDEKTNEIYFLDGTNQTLYHLNQELPIVLTEENILNYVKFFFNFTRGQQAKFQIIETNQDILWIEEPMPNAKKALGKMLKSLNVISMENQIFEVEASMLYKDSLFEIHAQVNRSGKIKIIHQELLVDDIPVQDDIFS